MNNRKNEYFICGNRPVKFVKDEDGMDVLVFDLKTKEFVRNLDYLTKVLTSNESEEVSEEEFNEYVEELKNKIK